MLRENWMISENFQKIFQKYFSALNLNTSLKHTWFFPTVKNALGFLGFRRLRGGQGGRFLTDAISGWRPTCWPLRGRPHGLFGGRPIIVSHGSFETGFLDFFGQPGDPDLLFFRRGRHQQHVFGRGGVVAHLAGWDALGYTIFVELCPETKKWCQIRRFSIIFKHLTYRHRLHSNAGGGLKGAHRGLEQRSQEAGMWYEIATNSCPFKSSIPGKSQK